MLTIELNQSDVKALKAAVEQAGKNLDRELVTAINKTAKAGVGLMAKQIGKDLNLPQREIKKGIRVTKRANKGSKSGQVTLRESKRPGLQHFKARQTRVGVSYKLLKSEGSRSVKSAFMGPKPGVKAPKLYGGAFIRSGDSRLPIRKLHGISPWGLYVKKHMDDETKKKLSDRLSKEIQKRAGQALRGF